MSLIQTQVQNLVVKTNLDKNEVRSSRYGVVDCFLKQTDDPMGIVTPELKEKVRDSIGRPKVQIPVIDYNGAIKIGDKRTVTIADSENTSRMIDLTFANYTWGFTMVPSLYMNNEIGYERDFRKKMMGYVYAFMAKLESVGLAHLATAKTQVVKNHLLYDFSTNAVNAKFDQREQLFGDIDIMMGSNDYYGGIDLIADPGVLSIYKKLQQHGANNDENKSNEFGSKLIFPTNGIPQDPSKYAQGYAIEKGSLGMMTRFERECLRRTRTADGHEWDIITLPGTGIKCGTYTYESVGDYNTIAGAASKDMDRVMKQHFGFAVEVGFISAYTSNPAERPSPILSFNISSENAVYGKPVYVAGGTVKTTAGA